MVAPNVFTVSATITPSLDELAKQYSLTDRQARQIGTVAINRSLTSVRSRVTKRLAAEINLKQAIIRDNIKVVKANFDRVAGRVEVERKPIPLIEFPHTVTKQGIRVKVRRTGGRDLLKSTFIARMKSGHLGIFERARIISESSLSPEDLIHYKAGALHSKKSRLVRPAGAKPRVARLPIQERFGVTPVSYLVNAPGVIEQEQAAAREILQKNVMSQLFRRLKLKSPTSGSAE